MKKYWQIIILVIMVIVVLYRLHLPNKNNLAAQTSSPTSTCQSVNFLPDKNCTPGALNPAVTQQNINQTICRSGYTKTIRPSESVTYPIKLAQMKAYGDTGKTGDYELDHLISLELGGAAAEVKNLWPEPHQGVYNSYDKDVIENYLNQQICQGQITLKTAQDEIRTNWIAVLNQYCLNHQAEQSCRKR